MQLKGGDDEDQWSIITGGHATKHCKTSHFTIEQYGNGLIPHRTLIPFCD